MTLQYCDLLYSPGRRSYRSAPGVHSASRPIIAQQASMVCQQVAAPALSYLLTRSSSRHHRWQVQPNIPTPCFHRNTSVSRVQNCLYWKYFTPWWCLEVSPSEFRMMPWGIIWSPPDRHNGNGDIYLPSIFKPPYGVIFLSKNIFIVLFIPLMVIFILLLNSIGMPVKLI